MISCVRLYSKVESRIDWNKQIPLIVWAISTVQIDRRFGGLIQFTDATFLWNRRIVLERNSATNGTSQCLTCVVGECGRRHCARCARMIVVVIEYEPNARKLIVKYEILTVATLALQQ